MPKLKFSRIPYYDTFSVGKNYLKVLFQPKRSIQVRELNQIQSAFNNQIEKFADHIFKFGSRVDAGSVKLETDIEYVKLQSTDVDGNPTDVSKFDGKKVKGLFSEVVGIVKTVTAADSIDPDTIYIAYTGAGEHGVKIRMQPGEPIEVQDSVGYTVRSVSSDATGFSTVFNASESTYYVYGTFVNCPQQSIVLSKYDRTATCKVGLAIDQSFIDYRDEPDLRDNAIGTDNYSAPGADRYSIQLHLIRKPINSANDQEFIQLAKIENGVMTDVLNKPQYSEITHMLARRTYDESGDYTVEPFYMELAVEDDVMFARLSDGKAYVKGYEVEKAGPSFLEITPANSTSAKTSLSNKVDYGNKMYVISYAGGPNFDPYLLPFTEFDIQPYGQGDSNGTMFIKSWEFAYNDGTDDYYLLNFFDTNFTFNYTNDDPLNTLYDIDIANTMLIRLPVENVVSIDGDVTFTDQTEAPQTVTYKSKTSTEGTVSVNLVGGAATLDVADAYELISVTQASVDITDNFELLPNAKDNYYEYSGIKLKDGVTGISGTVEVTYTYWLHGNDSGNCFSVESYTGVDYADIPTYTSNNGTVYNLRDVLDFRPIKDTLGNFVNLNAYPLQNTVINYESITSYDGSRDLVTIDTEGVFHHIQGDANRYPEVPDNQMAIYKLDLAANTTDPVTDVVQRYVENKRYTMRDIGDLDNQISNLENYVTLNLLEKDLETMTVTDSAGNNRYKNGFLVDKFNDLQAAATFSKDYQCGVDIERQELRPSFKRRDIKLAIDEGKSDHYQITGDLISLPYTDAVWHDQPWSSKTISVNPYFIFATEGKMVLDPANDVWTDTETEPAIKVNVDTGVAALQNIASEVGITGTFWGNPVTTQTLLDRDVSQQRSSSTRNRTSTDRDWAGTGFGIQTTTTTRAVTTNTTVTTTRDTIRADTTTDGVKKAVEAKTTEHSLGSKVKDVELLTYIRSTDVKVYGYGLKKGLRHYFYFDDIDVTEDVRPLNGAFGDPVYADSRGTLQAVFRIPNSPDKQFYVGTKIFRITNDPNNSQDPDELLSYAESQYHAGGLKQTKQNTILAVTAPEYAETDVQKFSSRTFTQTRRNVSSTTSSRVVGQSTSVQAIPTGQDPPRAVRVGRRADPIAQSFFVQEQDGVFLTKIDTFFSAAGTDHDVWLQVREMVNGYPGPKILPFGKLNKSPSDIVVDGVTTWTFESPVYLQGNTEYCFVIGSDDKEHRVYISKLGGEDIETGISISNQPHMGSMFKGQNNTTWNASQYEDIKFTMYKAEFDTSSDMVAAFVRNDSNTKEKMPLNPFETTSGSDTIRVHHLSHGLSEGDKIKFELLGDNEFDILIDSGDIVEGQTLTGANGTCVINQLTYVGVDPLTSKEKYTFRPSGLFGYFSDAESVTGAAYSEPVGARAEAQGAVATSTNTALVATLPTGIDNTFNGIPLKALSKKSHTVTDVDSLDTFSIKINDKADTTGRIGGSGNYMLPNIVMEAFDLRAAVMDFEGTGTWYYDSVRHAGVGSMLQNDQPVTDVAFDILEFSEFDLPVKLNTELVDVNKYQDGRRSFVAYGTYNSTNPDLSPVINISSIGMQCFGNRIDFNDSTIHLDWTDETNNLGEGSEKAKYVTNIVKLDDPAEDIKVWMDVLNNENTELQLWYRTLDEQSYESILDEDWVQVEGLEWPANEEEFIEVEFDLTPIPGQSLPPFKEFQVKIVMKAKNSARVPKIKRFRCLALT